MNGGLIFFKPETVKVGNSCVNGIVGQLVETVSHLEKKIQTDCKSLIHLCTSLLLCHPDPESHAYKFFIHFSLFYIKKYSCFFFAGKGN